MNDNRRDDEAESDDFEDEDRESLVCPICREDYCNEHLVAATCCDDVAVRGAIGMAWEIGMPLAESVLRRAYLKGGATAGAGVELDGLLRELRSCNRDVTDDGFDEACVNLRADHVLRNKLLGELRALPDVMVRGYVHPGGMPGLSTSGENYYTVDPAATAAQWLGRVMVTLWNDQEGERVRAGRGRK